MAFEHIYRPQHKSDTEIVNDFVVRNALFDRLMFDIRKDGPGKLSQHHMVQGLRGMGKSTLFERIRVEMKEPELSERWLTVKTAEENWPVNSLLDFWIWIGQHMAAVDPAGFGVLGDLGTLWNKDEQHEQCFTTIEARLRGTKKKLLLLVDNVGDLFRKFSKQENHALRELLVSNKHIKLIGGTAVRLDELETHDAPYFDLFKEHHLAGLNQEEVIALLGHYARKNGSKEVERVVKDEPHRVDHLRILTGGVPRTIMMLLDVFDKDGDASVFDDLRRTLDLVTPLYKHRMDELSPQKQKIVHALAMNWDGMSAGEIGAATRLESKVASAQLGQLVRDGFVLRDETSTKNHFYQVAERFFNIWYLMNNAQRNGPQKVRWLTRFFELWCDEKGLKERATRHADTLGSWHGSPSDHLLVTNAMLSSELLDIGIKEQLYERTVLAFPEHFDQLLPEAQWRTNERVSSWRLDVYNALNRTGPESAEKILRNSGVESDPWMWIFHGDIAMMRGDFTDAHKNYMLGLATSEKRVNEAPQNTQLQRDLAISYNKLGRILLQLGKQTQANEAYASGTKIIQNLAQLDPRDEQAQADLSLSCSELGDLLFAAGKYAQAREKYQESLTIIRKLVVDHPNDVQALRAKSMVQNKLGDVLLEEGHDTEARKAYEGALRLRQKVAEEDPFNGQLQRDLLVSFGKLGDLLIMEGKNGEARKAIEACLAICEALVTSDPDNTRVLRDLALSHWKLYRLNEIESPIAKSHYVAYEATIDLLVEEAVNLWKHGTLTSALSQTAQLMAAPMYTGSLLNALLWGMAREQYHGLRELFEERYPRLKDEMRPVYFALLRLMKDEDPDSHRRMGKELEEPVQAILARVEEMRKELGQPSDMKSIKEKAKAPRKAAVKKKRPQ